jgi:hypothetical protein
MDQTRKSQHSPHHSPSWKRSGDTEQFQSPSAPGTSPMQTNLSSSAARRLHGEGRGEDGDSADYRSSAHSGMSHVREHPDGFSSHDTQSDDEEPIWRSHPSSSFGGFNKSNGVYEKSPRVFEYFGRYCI